MTGRRSGRRRRRTSAGFTLFEMLGVLALLALATSIGATLMRPPSLAVQVEASARRLCAALRLTRARAIADSAELALTVDVGRRTYASPVAALSAFPNGASVEFTVANRRRIGRTAGDFLFYPGGGSTGGDVLIVGGGRRAEISVNWLTGDTKCDIS